MKKLTLITLCTLISSGAMAADFTPYIGFDLQQQRMDYNKSYAIGGFNIDGNRVLEDALNGGALHIGTDIHPNFGVELGYFQSRNAKRDLPTGSVIGNAITNQPTRSKIQISGWTLDGIGYYPISDDGQFKLLGTAGIGWNKLDLSWAGASADEREFGWRVGGGLHYQLHENVSARGIIRYSRADFDNIADNAWQYSIGLNYHF